MVGRPLHCSPSAQLQVQSAVIDPCPGVALPGEDCGGVGAVPDDAGDAPGDGHYDVEAREYRLFARRPYRAGEQVFLCYGGHTSLELLGARAGAMPSALGPWRAPMPVPVNIT